MFYTTPAQCFTRPLPNVLNDSSHRLLWQITPASSLWEQSCTPKSLWWQSVRLGSLPRHVTSSSQMGWPLAPWPRKPRPRAMSAPWSPAHSWNKKRWWGGVSSEVCPLRCVHLCTHVYYYVYCGYARAHLHAQAKFWNKFLFKHHVILTKLSTNDVGVLDAPAVVTHRSPLSIETNLHPTVGSIAQSNGISFTHEPNWTERTSLIHILLKFAWLELITWSLHTTSTSNTGIFWVSTVVHSKWVVRALQKARLVSAALYVV